MSSSPNIHHRPHCHRHRLNRVVGCGLRAALPVVAFVVILASAATRAPAHPVSFEGATQLMIEAGEDMQMFELYHSITASQAFGPHFLRLDGKGVERDLMALQYNRLLKRWNLPDAQANIYAGIGAGASYDRGPDRWSPAMVAIWQADYETRRIYTAYEGMAWFGDGFTHVGNSIGLGVAPYLAEFDELNTWLLLKARHVSEFDNQIEVMPMLRFFYRNLFLEVGATLDGNPQVNFMIHF